MPKPFEEETSRFLAAWMRVRQIVQAANFNRFQREGLSATQFMTLNVIPAEGLTLSELARKLNLSPATLSETVKSLEERALLRRTRSTDDARKLIIRTTAAGARMQNVSSQEFHQSMAGLFRAMSKQGRTGLLTGLEEMVTISDEPGETGKPTRRGGGVPPAMRNSR